MGDGSLEKALEGARQQQMALMRSLYRQVVDSKMEMILRIGAFTLFVGPPILALYVENLLYGNLYRVDMPNVGWISVITAVIWWGSIMLIRAGTSLEEKAMKYLDERELLKRWTLTDSVGQLVYKGLVPAFSAMAFCGMKWGFDIGVFSFLGTWVLWCFGVALMSVDYSRGFDRRQLGISKDIKLIMMESWLWVSSLALCLLMWLTPFFGAQILEVERYSTF